jgi:hypothetical protein
MTPELRVLQAPSSFRLQQLWRNRINGREEWRDVPVVVEGSAG